MNDKTLKEDELIAISALLVHAAKIDEDYQEKEKEMIQTFIKSYNSENANDIFKKAEELEKNSNQIIEFTNTIKKQSNENKSKIIEKLWKILISDNTLDNYESNLMRRICGLIYFPDKLSGEIKLKGRSSPSKVYSI